MIKYIDKHSTCTETPTFYQKYIYMWKDSFIKDNLIYNTVKLGIKQHFSLTISKTQACKHVII